MKASLFLVLFVGCLNASFGQPILQLSEKHLQKVLAEDNPVKKRKAYLRYYHKDSLRYVKEVDRYWQAKFDNVNSFVSKKQERINKISGIVEEPLKRLEAGMQIRHEMYRFPSELEQRYSREHLDDIYSSMRYYLKEMSSDTSGVLINALKTDLPFIASLGELRTPMNLSNQVNGFKGFGKSMKKGFNDKLNRNEYVKEANELKGDVSNHLVEFKQYEQYANMTPDSLLQVGVSRLEKEAQSQLMGADGFESYQKQLNQYTQMESQYKGYLNDLQDSTARKEMAKKKAEEMAMQYISENPSILEGVQKKMSLLMKKYSTIVNSNDLSTAVKRTSLSGRTFSERLVIATNFQLLSIDPFSVDLAPQIGYRFNSLFSLGLGGTYRKTFNDSIPSLSPEVFGYKAFVSYDILNSFFAYGEYAQNSPGVTVKEGISQRIWKPAALLGVGRRFSLHKNVDMTVVALYNFIHSPGDPVYPRPFMVRFGFQLSDVALLKKKPDVKLF